MATHFFSGFKPEQIIYCVTSPPVCPVSNRKREKTRKKNREKEYVATIWAAATPRERQIMDMKKLGEFIRVIA